MKAKLTRSWDTNWRKEYRSFGNLPGRLTRKNIQPVWLGIENNSNAAFFGWIDVSC